MNAGERRKVLATAIQDVLGEPITFGTNGCATWAADVLVSTGQPDPIADYRGRWKTARGALRLINQAGGFGSLLDEVAQRQGWSEIAVSDADILCPALIETREGLAVGLFDGFGFVHRVERGVETVLSDRVVKCWGLSWG